MWIGDTHLHLDDEQFYPDVEEIIRRAEKSRLRYLINPSVSLHSAEKIRILSSRHPKLIFLALGFHPHSADRVSRAEIHLMQEHIKEWKPIAIGETGLDWVKTYSSRQGQIALLEQHIQWAQSFHLPLIVHMRESEKDLLRILSRVPEVRGVVHSFSGDFHTAEEFLSLGWYLSFSGTVTYPRGTRVREIARMVPDDKILVETDAPYLAPQKYRGKRCTPEMVWETIEVLALLREQEVSSFVKQLNRNAVQLFSLSGVNAE